MGLGISSGAKEIPPFAKSGPIQSASYFHCQPPSLRPQSKLTHHPSRAWSGSPPLDYPGSHLRPASTSSLQGPGEAWASLSLSASLLYLSPVECLHIALV